MIQWAKKFHELYQGPPISLWITGGGFGFLDVLKIPGASRFISDVIIPYSEKDILARLHDHRMIDPLGFGSASEDAVRVYAEYLEHATTVGNGVCLAVSAALSTNRWRRGTNRAFFCTRTIAGTTVYRLDMMKPQKIIYQNASTSVISTIRAEEDDKVSKAMMAILTGNMDAFPLDLNNESMYAITLDHTTEERFVKL